MVDIEQENTFKRALTEGVNLFLGSGFSVLATDTTGHPMPTGATLFDELVTEFRIPNPQSLSLSQLCTIIEATKRDQLYLFLKRRFTVASFDPRYNYLNLLRLKSIFTTNIDDLLFNIYASSTSHYLHDIVLRGPAHRDKSAIDFIALHGSVAREMNPLYSAP